MHLVEVTEEIWRRLLMVREGKSCLCCGDFSEGQQAALALYGPLSRRDVGPLITGQIGQSLDGRIATTNGDVGKVSGPDGILHLHRMRALVDAVLIGVKTALHDSPQLTVRHCEGPNPARVVIDIRGRLPNDSPVLADDGSRRIIIQTDNTARTAGIEVIRLPATNGAIAPSAITEALRSEGLSSLLVEGGSFTIGKFIEAGLLDLLHLALAPVLIGNGPAGLNLSQPDAQLEMAIRPETRAFTLGSELILECGLTKAASASAIPLH
jgi:riboflavin-specific deaminase-like protein